MDQIPDESVPLEQSSRINDNRRRRTRRLIVPSGKTERSLYVNEIAKRLVPGLDFYLFTALCSVVLCAAILLDHPTIYILAALLAPFMAPLIGLGFSMAVGSFKFFLQSLGSLAIGSAFIFFGGLLSGWISRLIPGFHASQAQFYTSFSFSDLILLLIGTILAIFLTVKVPKQRSLIASVALAYEVYLPIGVAGFGLTSGITQLCGSALRFAGISILLVIIIGSIVLAFLRLRPFTPFGYLLTALLLGGAVYSLIMSGPIKSSLQQEVQTTTLTATSQEATAPPLSLTETPFPPTSTIPMPVQVTPTNTLVPTRTPTVTSTSRAPEVYAKVNVDVGVNLRQCPSEDNAKCPLNGPAIENSTTVQVIDYSEDNLWAQIRLTDGREGWVGRSYLLIDNQ